MDYGDFRRMLDDSERGDVRLPGSRGRSKVPADRPEEGIIRRPAIAGVAVGELTVCPACREIHGWWFGADHPFEAPRKWMQECGCDVRRRTEEGLKPRPQWPGFDFNCALELCRGCGMSAIGSGTRWSRRFCTLCDEDARRFNEEAGTYVVPVGRHTMMGGIGLGRGHHPTRVEVKGFIGAVKDLGEAYDLIAEWRRVAVTMNIAEAGLPDGEDVPLTDYLAGIGPVKLKRAERFEGLVEYVLRPRRRGSR